MLEFTPHFTASEAVAIARDHFGLIVAEDGIKTLPSERDQNFLLSPTEGSRCVLKICNAAEDPDFIAAQNELLRHVARRDQSQNERTLDSQASLCSQLIPAQTGCDIVTVPQDDREHAVRLVSFLDGRPLADVAYRSPDLLKELGRKTGRLTTALDGFDHAALHRSFHWDLQQARSVIDDYLPLIADADHRQRIARLMQRFDHRTAPLLHALPKAVIHNDANDGNVIVDVPEVAGTFSSTVTGIIDFGDAVHSWRIGELAVAVAYGILDQPDPLAAAANIVAGYCAEFTPGAIELEALYGLIILRLSLSAAMAAEQTRHRPDDPYLNVSQSPIRRTLPALEQIPFPVATETFRSAAGRSTGKSSRLVDWLKTNSEEFAFVLSANRDKVCRIDWSVESDFLVAPPDKLSINETQRRVDQILARHGADIGIGFYLEPRLIYASAQYADAGSELENRTIHLGIDLFAPAKTDVIAPLDGTVAFVKAIDAPLDYGTLVILEHEVAHSESFEPLRFWTLYGHLDKATAAQLKPGQAITKGERFAALGNATENGGWVPHLHFQILRDRCDFPDNFPGACRHSRQATWAQICPDPNWILRLPFPSWPESAPSLGETLTERKNRLGANLSLGYDQPLKIVRGRGQYLYDQTARQFLDAYNNVPHVGHCHPRITAVLERQSRLLNTNTRYLHDLQTEFAERLTSTLPDSLQVCYFVNSASEANELALRLARAFTQQRDMIVLEGAYHGHSTSLIDISPYKHDGPGGTGAPDWVHTAPVADTYRGPFKNYETAGAKYAATVNDVIEQLVANNRGLCGFIAESCPSVGGQILFPDGYLSAVYESVRTAGGVCIADDVQTGYGRLGSAFYGFELQRVEPDIVVLGKPIGNGHPLAAVITTREIADAFHNGMEFFSTFGGNTVSCAVGIEVLKITQEENLQANALAVGNRLLNGFRELQTRHAMIGDVRGSGLFLGIELVRDRTTLEPAAREASFISNQLRHRGILIGTDGPLHNVLKIRPPMVFDIANADRLLDTLDCVFRLL